MRGILNPPERWGAVIADSHASLIETDFLLGMGAIYAREFRGEAFTPDQTVAAIPRGACHFEQADEISSRRSGFDLPCLFQPEGNWSGSVIGVLGQDPLRHGGWSPILTCSTPWGLSAASNRRKGTGRLVWAIVAAMLEKGVGVYLTDVTKLYVEPDKDRPFRKSDALIAREQAVLAAEHHAVAPRFWVTFGQRASVGLRDILGTVPTVPLPHPNARGRYLQTHFNTPTGNRDSIAQAMVDEISTQL